jgi:hypothetical protein
LDDVTKKKIFIHEFYGLSSLRKFRNMVMS